jgi:ATP-binding cassette subfamily B protein
VLIVDHDVEGLIARVADHICVLENGRILETGTHQELAGRPGLYRRLLEAARDAGPPATKPMTAQPEPSP